jgi:hypothetical protein
MCGGSIRRDVTQKEERRSGETEEEELWEMRGRQRGT